FVTPEYCRGRAAIQPMYLCAPELTGQRGRAPAELLLETQSSIEGGRDIDHVYALEEFMPGRGSPERHSSRGILPYGNHHAGQVGSCCAALERLLDPRLF